MNVLEQYVTNITSESKRIIDGVIIYELVCDIECYGNVIEQEHIYLLENDYKMVKEKGYYLA